MRRRTITLLCVGVALASIVGIVVYRQIRPGDQVAQAVYSEAALAALPQHDGSRIDTSHLAAGVTPPTNRWFSGLALQAVPQRVFPLPLSVTPGETLLSVDMPTVEVSEKTIMATPRLPLTLRPEGAHYYRVTRYDAASVELTYFTEENTELAVVTITAGSPYIYYVAQVDTVVKVSAEGAEVTRRDSALTFILGETTLTAAPFAGAEIADDLQSITAPRGSLVTVFAVTSPDDWQQLMHFAQNPVVKTTVSFERDNERYVTSITYETANQQPTLYARLPHHGGTTSGPHYDTIYGQITLEQGNVLQYQTPVIPVKSQLNLASLSASDKQWLTTTLQQETATLGTYPEDTYFGGKMLYRDAQLLLLARQLGQTEIAERLRIRLEGELVAWLKPDGSATKAFYYDSRVRGVVGNSPAFGSEMFNDHHFHYGYFIYAASVLAQVDERFVAQYGDAVDLLVADIAHPASDDYFPAYRVYDAYFGHSWASGDAPFADGNNQESSSEAINAWVGLSLWADQTSDAQMSAQAGWLLSNESATAAAYWLQVDRSAQPYSRGYTHTLVTLNWGGKRDYATFFSSNPKAMLGIQLIPMNPTAAHLVNSAAQIEEQLVEARQTQLTSQQFDDYLLMYEAHARGGSDLFDAARALPDSAIDGANSRTYLYAWLLVHSTVEN